MKQIFNLLLLGSVLFTGFRAGGQARISSEQELQLLKATPMETVYLHSNATLFFPGEYLYYSLYTINMQSFRLSDISKVAYVQLVGEDSTIVFTQKVPLDGGKGQGDYFFPTSLPSGNYKLVGFTHWMKNAGPAQFFTSDLTFLNPYRSDQDVFLNVDGDGLSCPSEIKAKSTQNEQAPNAGLALELEQSTYATGAPVRVELQNYRGALGYGTYSLSVRRTDKFPHAGRIPATDFAHRYSDLKRRMPQQVNDILAIPEQRGELISGRVYEKDTNTPLKGRLLALSLPGDHFQIKTALTDLEGKFYTYVNRPFPGKSGIVELMPPGRVPATFEWYSPASWEGALPCFYHFELNADMEGAIRQRSIHNQIENSYFEVKPDTLQPRETSDPFAGETPVIYKLEDYTRFPTLRETIVEILEHVWIKRGGRDSEAIMVYLEGESARSRYGSSKALVVADGILVPDHAAFLQYDARNINQVQVIRQNYQLGGTQYKGVLVFETLEGQFGANWKSDYGVRFRYLSPATGKAYFRQGIVEPHIPDLRYQLLWEPNIELQGPSKSLHFFTSQVPGHYEVVLEGFTSYGKPISLKTNFEVMEK